MACPAVGEKTGGFGSKRADAPCGEYCASLALEAPCTHDLAVVLNSLTDGLARPDSRACLAGYLPLALADT